MANLFRKSSIEKLSSPEQLDKALTITSPMSWLALIGITLIIVATLIWSIFGTLPTMMDVSGIVVDAKTTSTNTVFNPENGTVSKVYKKSGDRIYQGDKLYDLINGKKETKTITAKQTGVIAEVFVQETAQVMPRQEAMRILSDVNEAQVIVFYVPLAQVQSLKKDMKVLITPANLNNSGHMEGIIINIDSYASSSTNMAYVLGTENMVIDQFLQNGPVVAVTCQIKADNATKSKYYWSNKKGKKVVINDGILVSGKIIIDEQAPISKLISNLGD